MPIIKKNYRAQIKLHDILGFFYLNKNVSLKMGKISPKYYIAYFELCNSFDNGCLFFSEFLIMRFYWDAL